MKSTIFQKNKDKKKKKNAVFYHKYLNITIYLTESW